MNSLESRSLVTTQGKYMKFYKHDTNAMMDHKLQKVVLEFGMEGYGMYWFCLELIAGGITEDDQSFELKHDREVIARMSGLVTDMVSKILERFVELELFEGKDGKITCLRLLTRLDKSMTSSNKLRKHIGESKAMVKKSGLIMIEEEQEKEKDKPYIPFDLFWMTYPRKEKKSLAKKSFLSKIKPDEISEVMKKLEAFKLTEAWTKDDGKFIPHASTWINQRRWEDDLDTTVPAQPKYRSLREIAAEEAALFSQSNSEIPE